MKLTIESTDELVRIDGVPVRRWEGTTEGGHQCHVFVHMIGVPHDGCVPPEFDRELIGHLPELIEVLSPAPDPSSPENP